MEYRVSQSLAQSSAIKTGNGHRPTFEHRMALLITSLSGYQRRSWLAAVIQYFRWGKDLGGNQQGRSVFRAVNG